LPTTAPDTIGLMKSRLRRVVGRLASPSRTGAAAGGGQDRSYFDEQWDDYAREWDAAQFKAIEGHDVTYLGDEWTARDPASGLPEYGLSPDVVLSFDDYLREKLIDPYLPRQADQGLEIGPGGGRITALLLPRTQMLHVSDLSAEMLAHLRTRFPDAANLRCHQTDGVTLPPLPPRSLDYVFAFDVFVHLEPRLIYWYLKQAMELLKPGGAAVIHYANATTPLGWDHFVQDLEPNLQRRVFAGAFSVMCPQLMRQFLSALNADIVATDLDAIPRDAVAVFRRRSP
jgi:SAM-dependent methyltransferase